MTPINWDARLEDLFEAEEMANKIGFNCPYERELYINAFVDRRKLGNKYNVLYSQGKPIVVDGRVKRRYNSV